MEEFVLIKENDFTKARTEIRKNAGMKIIFASDDDELSRKILEKEKINILLINQSGRKDSMKQRNSGFNHVLARIAKKNEVEIGINLDEIINSGKAKKSDILARVRQNARICNKNKLKMKFISFENKRDAYDLKSLGLVLGMPTKMIKDLQA
ncbi:hypothetical protein HY449_02130 [Candidatus Pacearchaeota archaeon]|nr:hypothetical protein [Candidatus Pacearchaeota archaeon]